MARQQSKAKLLYYPTPLSVVNTLATWFTTAAGHFTRVVDPCAGEGAAAQGLAQALRINETWGIELSYARAEKAALVLDRLLPTSFYTVSWSNASASLIFNNPPYDFSDTRDEHHRRLRHELLFLKGCTPRLVVGGLHILIISQALLGNEALARHWLGWYDQTRLWRFPDGEYETFKQVVLIGIKQAVYAPPKDEALQPFMAQCQAALPVIPECTNHSPYLLPPAPRLARFEYTPCSEDDIVRLGAQANPLAGPEWRKVIHVPPLAAPIRPLLPVKLGHLSMLISAGELGVVKLPLAQGTALLKGALNKTRTVTTTTEQDEDGQIVTQGEEREQLQTELTLLHADGNCEAFNTPDSVAKFITQHGGPLAEGVLARNAPFYTWHPTATEWHTAGQTALGLPPLPGRPQRGLFEVQKHFAIAAARYMRPQRHVILNCDMGFGKTATTIATLEQRNRWPALVLCPGHMVDKWRRDAEVASNPAAPITARIITRPARSEATWLATRVLPLLAEHDATLLNDERWQVAATASNDSGLRRRLTIAGGTEALRQALVKLTTVRKQAPSDLNPDGAPTLRPLLSLVPEGFTLEYIDRDDYTLADFFADYDQGQLGPKGVAICSFDPAKYDAGIAAIQLPKRLARLYDAEHETFCTVHARACPQCGGAFTQGVPDVCYHTVKIPKRDVSGHLQLDDQGCVLYETRRCGTPLYELSRWRRVGLSRLVQRKYRHRFKVYIADEVHEAQNGRSDIGACDGRLTSAIRDSLALTGTLFGGTASSLFYLLYRRNRAVRQRYAYTDVSTWIDHFGLWKYRWTEFELGDERGASTGLRRLERTPDELPGVSPAVIRYLLPCTLFGKIADLGYALPPLTDKVVTVPMGPELGKHYTEASDELLEVAMKALKKDRDPSLLSAWFNTCRYRPMSAFRPETVRHKDTDVLTLPAVQLADRALPKEEKLIELIAQNWHRGRKTLVFVEQTSSRDIRPHLAQLLRNRLPGLSVLALSAGDLKPAHREAWIRRHAPALDVLLVNAALVKTGLDLVMFNDIIFYETNLSLYTVWQSMRRVWRLGQSQPVTTTFLAYSGTLEAALLDHLGTKMKGAMLLYGDNAAGALVENNDDADLARELIRRALAGKAFDQIAELQLEGRSLFGSDSTQLVAINPTPVGTPVASSLPLPIIAVQLSLFSSN